MYRNTHVRTQGMYFTSNFYRGVFIKGVGPLDLCSLEEIR